MSTSEQAVTDVKNSLQNFTTSLENVITNEAVTIKKDLQGYVTTFEQDERAFKESLRGRFMRFLATIFRF